MPIIVNTNVSSLNAQRQLTGTTRAMNKAMERLASGLRINRAGDDAAGLAIATSLQTQVRGLTQATRNAGDGLSVVSMAEGAVTQQTGILQRIRELSVQAANEVNSPANLAQIQSEIDDQISELTRIGNTVEFNGKNLIDGSFNSVDFQVGSRAYQTINVSIGDFRAAGMGAYATLTSDLATGVDTSTAIVAAAGTADSLVINGVQVGSSAGLDNISTNLVDNSAIAKAAAINAVQGQTGVTAEATAAIATGTAAVAAGNITGSVTINGVTVVDGTTTPFVVAASDSNGALRDAINAASAQTGVVATLDSGGTKLVLTAEDGRNIDLVSTATATAMGFGASITATYGGGIELTSTQSINLTIGAANADATNLGFVATDNTPTAVVDQTKAVSQIDVTASGGAAQAILTVDAALSQVADAQSDLGALTNRLENTISNLEISIENLTASESRIRDADFAVETANLTRAQILQQSSIAILSQANLAPQAALSLLG
jgi:flagellin